MAELNRTSCCGVREYDGLLEFDSVKPCLLDLYIRFYDLEEERGWKSGAFIMFSCPAYERRIPKLIKYIEEAGIGSCTLAPTVLNPNSTNNLQVMLFAPKHNEFHKWYKENAVQYPYSAGDKVTNVAKESARYGQIAIVSNIVGQNGIVDVTVIYESGAVGGGHIKDYKKVD